MTLEIQTKVSTSYHPKGIKDSQNNSENKKNGVREINVSIKKKTLLQSNSNGVVWPQIGKCQLFHSSIIHKSRELKATYHMMYSTHNVVSSHGEILSAHKQQWLLIPATAWLFFEICTPRDGQT